MIVDDDEAFLNVAQALLERDGVTVAGVAGSSAEAVQRVRALRPDVVLIDIRLGQESGFDAARQLAGDGQSAALIMISTYAGADYADLIAESPAAGFLPKAELSAAAVAPDPRGGLTVQGSHRGARPAHPDGRGLRVVAEFLRDPSGASRGAVPVEGRGDGPPDLAGAQHIAALQRRREQRVGLKGPDAAGVHIGLRGPARQLRPWRGPYLPACLPPGGIPMRPT